MDVIFEIYVTSTGLEPITPNFVNEYSTNHLAKLAKWLSVRLRTNCFWVRVRLQSFKLFILSFVLFLFFLV